MLLKPLLTRSLPKFTSSLILPTLPLTFSRHASSAIPPLVPVPLGTPLHDPELDPQLADLGYPKLSTDSRQLRSPRGWWDSQDRINFGEPVPENDDLQTMWAPDVHKVKPFSAFSQLITAFVGLSIFAGGVYLIQASPPALPRAYPYEGLVKELSGTDESMYAARPTSANEIEE